jgi:hypothetical protein
VGPEKPHHRAAFSKSSIADLNFDGGHKKRDEKEMKFKFLGWEEIS